MQKDYDATLLFDHKLNFARSIEGLVVIERIPLPLQYTGNEILIQSAFGRSGKAPRKK